MEKKASFSRDLITSFGWKIITTGLNLLVGILLARLLGPEGRGQYAIVTLSVSLVSLFGALGIHDASVYFAGQKENRLGEVLSSGLIFAFANGLLWTLLSLIFVHTFGQNYFSVEEKMSYSICLVAILPLAIIMQLGHSFLSLKKMNGYNLLMAFSILFNVAYLIIFLFLFKSELVGAYWAFLLANLSSCLFGVYLFYREINVFSFKFLNLNLLSKQVKLGVQFFLAGLGGFGVQRLNLFLLQHYLSAKEVGIYSVAMALPTLLSIIPTQLSLVFYPWVANLETEDEKSQLTQQVFRLAFFCCLLIVIPLILLLKPIIFLLYGTDYVVGSSAAFILLIGMVCVGLTGILLNYLNGKGLPRFGIWLMFISLGGNFFFGTWLISKIGLNGAAWSKTISDLIGITFLLIVFYKKSGVAISKLFIPQPSDKQLIFSFLNRLKNR